METYNKGKKTNSTLKKFSNSFNSKSCPEDIIKSICQIDFNVKYGSGFLIKLVKGNNPLYYLMSCEHILKTRTLQQEVRAYYNHGKDYFTINLAKDHRFFRSYSFLNLDVSVLEIISEDNIDKSFFIEANNIANIDITKILNEQIFIMQYPKEGQENISEGIINSINQYEFTYYSDSNLILSGSPIFVLLNNTFSIIGLHNIRKKNEIINNGCFINVPIESLKANLVFKKQKYDNGIYIGEFRGEIAEGYGKFVRNNNSYYIGQWLNDKEHGKGAIYEDINSKNRDVIYEGDFLSGLPNGFGKCFYETGSYYIGQFSDGLRNGKGTIYYKNGCVKYEGDFVDDKAEGDGKYIWENGEYYIGQFYNNLRQGKGIEYYKDGNKEYEGDFIMNKYDGHGTFYWKNRDYYVGDWSKGLQNGKGKIVSKDNFIIYEGTFSYGEKTEANSIDH